MLNSSQQGVEWTNPGLSLPANLGGSLSLGEEHGACSSQHVEQLRDTLRVIRTAAWVVGSATLVQQLNTCRQAIPLQRLYPIDYYYVLSR